MISFRRHSISNVCVCLLFLEYGFFARVHHTFLHFICSVYFACAHFYSFFLVTKLLTFIVVVALVFSFAFAFFSPYSFVVTWFSFRCVEVVVFVRCLRLCCRCRQFFISSKLRSCILFQFWANLCGRRKKMERQNTLTLQIGIRKNNAADYKMNQRTRHTHIPTGERFEKRLRRYVYTCNSPWCGVSKNVLHCVCVLSQTLNRRTRIHSHKHSLASFRHMQFKKSQF